MVNFKPQVETATRQLVEWGTQLKQFALKTDVDTNSVAANHLYAFPMTLLSLSMTSPWPTTVAGGLMSAVLLRNQIPGLKDVKALQDLKMSADLLKRIGQVSGTTLFVNGCAHLASGNLVHGPANLLLAASIFYGVEHLSKKKDS